MKTVLGILVVLCACGCASEAANFYASNDAGETETSNPTNTSVDTDTGTGSADTGSMDTGPESTITHDTSMGSSASETESETTSPVDTGTSTEKPACAYECLHPALCAYDGQIIHFDMKCERGLCCETLPVSTDTGPDDTGTGSVDTGTGSADTGTIDTTPPDDCAGICTSHRECDLDGGIITSITSLECTYAGLKCCEFPVTDTGSVIDTGPADTGTGVDTGPVDTGTGSDTGDPDPYIGPYCNTDFMEDDGGYAINCGDNPYEWFGWYSGICCTPRVYTQWNSYAVDTIRCQPKEDGLTYTIWFDVKGVSTLDSAKAACEAEGGHLASLAELDSILPCNAVHTLYYCRSGRFKVWTSDGETNAGVCSEPPNPMTWGPAGATFDRPETGICVMF